MVLEWIALVCLIAASILTGVFLLACKDCVDIARENAEKDICKERKMRLDDMAANTQLRVDMGTLVYDLKMRREGDTILMTSSDKPIVLSRESEEEGLLRLIDDINQERGRT